MIPSSLNQHLHNDQFSDGKLAAKVYERPSVARRILDFVDIVRSVTHQ